MVELNLIPDVKKELLKTQKVRSLVTSIAILVGIIAIGVVAILAGFVYGVQGAIDRGLDRDIETNQANIEGHINENTGTVDVLALQSQLQQIQNGIDNKFLASRIIGMVDKIRLSASATLPVTLQTLSFNRETNTINIEGQSRGSFEGVEAFKKAALLTTFNYAEGDQVIEGDYLIPGETAWNTVSQTFGTDADGNAVVRFQVSFSIDPNSLKFDSFNSEMFEVIAPGPQNVTDSVTQIPSDMFAGAAPEENGGQ